MGNETENVNQANTEKVTYNKTTSNMKIGVCEMQGWRKTMEDAAIVLPNYEKNTSLFGVLDGHGGSIVSEFVSVNFKNILIRTKSYKNGKYEQALAETFLLMDELLKNKHVNNFIYNTHNSKDKLSEIKKAETLSEKSTLVKLRFEAGTLEFDLDQLDLSDEGSSISATIYKQKPKLKSKEKNVDDNKDNSTIDDSRINQKGDIETDEKDIKNIIIDDIFFAKGGKQNASLNCLPTFEEIYDISQFELEIENKKNLNLELTKNSSSHFLHYTNYIAKEMGTTANIMLIKNGIIYIANVGDSLSIMYKNKKAYNLNKEHQPIIESEKQRVLKSGATITGYRINGMLNLTRAIGDLRFKSNKDLKRAEQSVIALPEITKIEDTEGIDFIIMGCDGLWDCVKRQMVCDFIDKEINANPHKKLSDILEKIFDRCVSPVSGVILGTDNMSCIIIQFLHSHKNLSEDIKIQKFNFRKNEENTQIVA